MTAIMKQGDHLNKIYFGKIPETPVDGRLYVCTRAEYDQLPSEVRDRYVWKITGGQALGRKKIPLP